MDMDYEREFCISCEDTGVIAGHYCPSCCWREREFEDKGLIPPPKVSSPETYEEQLRVFLEEDLP